MMDGYLAQLDELGWAIGAHRRSRHEREARPQTGEPNVIYLQDLLDEWLGDDAARVILPITDPYVVHHGALGSFATVYLPHEADTRDVIERLAAEPGIELVLDRRDGCERFELPPDRVGDVVVIGNAATSCSARGAMNTICPVSTCRCARMAALSEQNVPLLFNRPVEVGLPRAAAAAQLRHLRHRAQPSQCRQP